MLSGPAQAVNKIRGAQTPCAFGIEYTKRNGGGAEVVAGTLGLALFTLLFIKGFWAG